MKTIVKTMAALVMAAGVVGLVGCKHSTGGDENVPFEKVEPKFVRKDTINNIEYDIVEFGKWPQTKLADKVTITDTENVVKINGWDCYKGSDGEYYVKETVTQTHKTYDDNPLKFDDKTDINTSDEHYFKLEPIQWRVLTKDYNGKKLLFAEKALTVFNYGDDSNNYENSRIRAYLNGTGSYNNNGFINKAFTPAEIASIAVTNVDNSAASTIGIGQDNTDNIYAGGNTTDKIFLLSLQEITKAEYGFGVFNDEENQETTMSRAKKSTDYTRAKDIWVYTKDMKQKYKNYCCYWLRSPRVPLETDNVPDKDNNIIQSDLQVQMIGEDGRNGFGEVTENFAIVPALAL